MSVIQIVKADITTMDVDCIVNAANSSLAAGGGVCGAIFDAAGYMELQSACDEIGRCKTGDAVITPGFQLKAQYIIHAVGPVWYDGKHGEEEALLGCYQASLRLARQHDCHTIAFPLISSGIFGYPKKDAWQVALKAVTDFLNSNKDYELDVTFAVLSDSVLNMGNQMKQSMETEIADKQSGFFHVVRFHKTNEENGFLSNWFLRDFSIDGKKYCCVEQYMMEQKACVFLDFETAEKIMQTTEPFEMKKLGREVKHFVPVIWDGKKQLIVYKGVLSKFEQNPDLAGRLIATGTATPIECSETDCIWGIGLGMDDPNVANPKLWKGQNLLGFTLQAVRTELIRGYIKK